MTVLVAGIPGWVIPVAILIVSLITLTLILERSWLFYRQIRPLTDAGRSELLTAIREKRFDEATALCRLNPHPAYKVALSVLEARKAKPAVQRSAAVEELARQSEVLERYLPSLGTISTVAPLLGLLGTVTGMIKSFQAFELSSARSTQLMGGIDEALITTALGLMTAIPALIMYNNFVRASNRLLDQSAGLLDAVMAELEKNG